MSFFAKFNQNNYVTSTLVAGEETIVLKFKPLIIDEAQKLQKFAKMDATNIDEIVAAIDEITTLLAAKVIGDLKPTKEDFAELDIATLTAVMTDLAQGKKSVVKN
jgi:hypothetical protein